MRTFTSLGLVTIALCPLPAAAQVLTRPERAAEVISRNTDQTRSTQSLAFSLDLLGGYDQNDGDEFQVVDPDAPPVLLESSSTGTVSAGLAYSRVDRTRVLGVTVNGGTTFYGAGTIQDAGPTRNFNGAVTWTTPIGTSTRFSASQRFLYDSLYSFGAFEPLENDIPIGELPGSPAQGIAALDSFATDTTVGLEQRLGRRNSLNGSAGYSRRNYTGDEATGDTSSASANVAWARQLQRTTALNVTYGYSNGEYAPLVGGGTTRPLVGHAVQGGLSFSKRLSPRKAAQFSFAFGATRTDAVTGDAAVGYAFWAPSGSGQVRVDIGRTWALSGTYNRGITALSGLTLEAYNSSTLAVSLGGSVGRVSLAFSGGLAGGATGVGALESSEYTSYTGGAQASMPLGKNLSALAEYTYYSYDVTGSAALPSSMPPGYQRNTIRAGLSLRLPIIESR